MNVYADSSALVKAFVGEPGRDEFLEILAGATVVATARLAYVETRAAFARAARERRLTAAEARSAARAFDQRWTQLAVFELDDTLAREAAALADAHPLRGADAIHLAAAMSLAADDPGSVRFACWDARLWDQAKAGGFVMGPVDRPT
ncbi:MAG: type II toxin-antitoxin system VapC family toxin [Gammaproteobacteria bacterium]